jgi:hypothetical protein
LTDKVGQGFEQDRACARLSLKPWQTRLGKASRR